MTANIMISIETNGNIDSHLISLTDRGAETVRETLTRCQGLIPGEVATRLADAFSSLEGLEVMAIDTTAIPTMTPPADPPSMEPPPPLDGLDAHAAVAGIPTSPAGEPLDGAPV